MEKITDWITLWRELSESTNWNPKPTGNSYSVEEDPWRDRAEEFDDRTTHRFPETDPIREYVLSQVSATDTVLDIGAGTGRWSLYLAPLVRKVTAIDPSPAMLGRLRQNIASAQVQNVEIIEGFWPEVAVAAHHVSLCSHAMYASADFPTFINRMIGATRRTCFLVFRVPSYDGVMGEAYKHIHGQPNDSPNFIVGYNALFQMGIQANVLVSPQLRPWVSTTLEDALARLKQRLGMKDENSYDDYFKGLLRERLAFENGEYIWPDGMRSALVYWNIPM